MEFFPPIFILLVSFCEDALTMTVNGFLSSRSARFHQGQYITSFCFYGDGFFKHKLSQNSRGKIYFISEKRWSTARQLSCQDKLAAAEFAFELHNVTGEHRFVPWEMITNWHVVYADPSSCNNTLGLYDDISYTMLFMNKDSQGNPVNHFSYNQAGLLSFFKLVTFIYFITASFYGQNLWQTISKGGPMHQVIRELSIGVGYHALATLFMMTYLLWYAKDGNENYYLLFLVKVLQSLAEFKMLSMSIKVSFGWMLGSSKTVIDETLSRQIQLVVGICALLEFMLLLWEHTLLPCIIKCAVAGLVVFNIRGKLREERSSLRKDFYTSVVKSCCLWFLVLPFSTLATFLLPSYHRLKFVVICQRSAEMLAVFMLYKLFLSRSLYWEVSSLSSATLPLRLDKAFGRKSYDTYRR